jgi:hypothetical protein
MNCARARRLAWGPWLARVAITAIEIARLNGTRRAKVAVYGVVT